jgi:hypothetical protein
MPKGGNSSLLKAGRKSFTVAISCLLTNPFPDLGFLLPVVLGGIARHGSGGDD